MKRLLALLVCAALAYTAAGCAYAVSQTGQSGSSYDLYFERSDLNAAGGSDAVGTERVSLADADRMGTEAVARELMGQLLQGPTGEGLVSPIPKDTLLLGLTLDGSVLQVDLSGQYGALSGVGLTLADYCITLTLTQLPAVRSVSVTVRGQELAYRDKQRFAQSDVLLSTAEDVVGTVEVRLYFPDQSGKLQPESRMLDLYEGDTQVEIVVSALRSGPENRGLSAALPEAFAIQSVWTEDQTCYVDLPSSNLAALGSDAALIRTALEALADSLCSLSSVSEVRYLVDGEQAQNYGGVVVGEPFTGAE